MFGKFQIAASFAVIYVYAGELIPTVVRSESMGVSSFVAGLGLLMFPYINALVKEARIAFRNCLRNICLLFINIVVAATNCNRFEYFYRGTTATSCRW